MRDVVEAAVMIIGAAGVGLLAQPDVTGASRLGRAFVAFAVIMLLFLIERKLPWPNVP